MKDISKLLTSTIEREQCTALTAFLRVKEGENNGIRILQPKSAEQARRRLRNTSDSKADR